MHLGVIWGASGGHMGCIRAVMAISRHYLGVIWDTSGPYWQYLGSFQVSSFIYFPSLKDENPHGGYRKEKHLHKRHVTLQEKRTEVNSGTD